MNRVSLVATFVIFAGSAFAADFPAADKLPAQPGLPDPLVFLSGDKVKSKEEWGQKRRPELKELFQHYMYGYLLPKPEKIDVKVERTDKKAFDGKATLKEVTITIVGTPEAPRIHLLLVVPNERKNPAPCFVGMNFCGNHAAVKDAAVRIPTAWIYNGTGVKDNRATDAGRGAQLDTWAIDQTIARGYAVATFYSGDVDPDRSDLRQGIQLFYPAGAPLLKGEKEKPKASESGTIAAWAWGIHRAVDYLVADPDIDKTRIAVMGHSRLGKTALLAAAFDERIALAIPHQAGCGGTAPSRGKVGESVKQINDRFPHWFNGNFKDFNDKPERLPFDQNGLVALVAPRPVLFSNAVEDQWANPNGQFEVLKAADPVYRLLGAGGLDAKEPPEPGKLVDSTLGYFIRPGKHSTTRDDWKIFCDFADKQLGKK